jgi:hypothetical protein
MCRNKESGWGGELTPAEQIQKAREEISVRLHAIVPCPHGTDVRDIVDTARSLETQTHPVTVHFVLVSNTPNSGRVFAALRKEFPPTSRLAWNVRIAHERDRDGRPLQRRFAVDLVANQLSPADCTYYAVMDPGAIAWSNLTAQLEEAVNGRLEQFFLVDPVHQCNYQFGSEDLNARVLGPIVHLQTHRFVGGSARAVRDEPLPDGGTISVPYDDVSDKIRKLVGDSGRLDFVRRMHDVCPPPQ